MKIIQFSIIGRVIESRSGKPLANLKVEAWDKDIKYNDLLGQTFTDVEGQFDISFDSTYFREHSPDERPDLLFKVFLGKRLLKIEGDTILKNAGERTEVTLKIFMPEMITEGKDRISMTKALEISDFLQKSDFNGLIEQVKETANNQFKFVTDMFKNSFTDFDFTPIKVGDNQRENVVGQDVDVAANHLLRQNVQVNEVKKYEPKLNKQSLSDLTKVPLNLKPGQKVDLYEVDGKVRYYSIVKESKGAAENNAVNETEAVKLQEELLVTRQLAADKDVKISKLEMEMELLKKDHNEIKALLKSDALVKLMQQTGEKEVPTVTKRQTGKTK